jgi:hypothetical protein
MMIMWNLPEKFITAGPVAVWRKGRNTRFVERKGTKEARTRMSVLRRLLKRYRYRVHTIESS